VDKYAARGVKKLFSLARTKMRLADEAGTEETRPRPLPLVKIFAGAELSTLAECKSHWQMLKDGVDLGDGRSAASATLQLCDIIEGVKYLFEPEEYMPLARAEEFERLRAQCMRQNLPMHVLLMSSEAAPCSVYLGEEPPPGALHFSRVISGIAPLLRLIYASPHFSDGIRPRNITVVHGSATLLGRAVEQALRTLAA
jgi:hypothetical protein